MSAVAGPQPSVSGVILDGVGIPPCPPATQGSSSESRSWDYEREGARDPPPIFPQGFTLRTGERAVPGLAGSQASACGRRCLYECTNVYVRLPTGSL